MKPVANKKLLAASLFPITGLEGMVFKSRFLRLLDPIPNDNFRPIRMQRWADDLWRGAIKCPVFPTMRDGRLGFLVPAESRLEPGRIVSVPGVSDQDVRIEVTNELREIDIQNASPDERELISKMIERVISDKFIALSSFYWRGEWTLYFRLRPENESILRDPVNAYRGLKFNVMLLEDGGLLFASDIRTRYIGRRSLTQYTQSERETDLASHLDLTVEMEDRATFARDNGTAKFSCRFNGFTGKNIGEYRFPYDGGTITILEYYRQRYPRLSLKATDEAVFFGNPGKKQENESDPACPASRMFPVFTTEDDSLRNCSIKPQIGPEERVQAIYAFLRDLNGLSYAGRPFSITQRFVTRERSILMPPRLLYGKSQVLAPFPERAVPGTLLPDLDRAIVNWRNNKVPMLYKYGPFCNEPVPDVVFFHPENFPKNIREDFLTQLDLEILKQTGARMNLLARRSYRTGPEEREGSSLLATVKNVVKNQPGMFLALVVLWDRFSADVYPALKELLKRQPSQCVTEQVVRTVANTGDPARAVSRVRNLALGVLTCAGVQPWILADDLHYDTYIGIDTLHGRVSYHFLFGPGCRRIVTAVGSAIRRGRAHESLDKGELSRKIESGLREIHSQGFPMRKIVVHRDGRWWKRESHALRETIARLQQPNVGVLGPDCTYSVVEIRKSHAPVRLFTALGPSGNQLVNPLPGTFLKLDSTRALLATTGRPGAWERGEGRTAGTLLLNLVESSGSADIELLTEDAYRLTHLNWNAPEIEISVPVTIRWNDQALRVSLLNKGEDEDETPDAPDSTTEQLQETHV